MLVRFGRWEEVLDLKLPPDRRTYCVTTAIILAFGVLGRIAEAGTAQEEFEAARAAVPSSRHNGIPCKGKDVLGVASAVLVGELECRKGDIETALSSLQEAIKREDAIAYTDPPSWMQPVRHTLSGLLLEQNCVDEAEMLFGQDLGFAKDYPRRRA